MKPRKRIAVKKVRYVTTCAELWHTSRVLLMKGQKQVEGSVHQFRASLVFTAFTLEAFLNHVGEKIFDCWNDHERLKPKDKLDVIAKKIGLEINYGKRPWQTTSELFGFRNDIAHGKSVKIEDTKEKLSAQNYEKHLHEFYLTKWGRYCTRENAERASDDVEAMVRAVLDKSGIRYVHPFTGGSQFSHAEEVDDPGQVQ